MKNKNGFTLVELLAVIAILAILVIIALPNVMGMFNTAKKNSFTTEIKEIYKQAQQQWISDSLLSTNEQLYIRCSTCSGKSLDLTGRKELNYYIKFNKAGDVNRFYATDGSYQYAHEGALLITDIKDVETVADLEDNKIIRIENNGIVNSLPTPINFTIVETDFYKTIYSTKTYQATSGMTWSEWLNSSYNVDNITYTDDAGSCWDNVYAMMNSLEAVGKLYPTNSEKARYSNTIIEGHTYYHLLGVGCEI